MKKAMKKNKLLKITKIIQIFYLIINKRLLQTQNKTQGSVLKMFIKVSGMKRIQI